MTEYGPSDSYAAAAHFEHIAAPGHTGVVLLHGLGGDLMQPRKYTGAVIDGRPASRLAADARLHGLTHLDDPDPITFDMLAADIAALVDAVGLPAQRVWVGVSMGAATALRVALRDQSQVRALVLIRPAWLNRPHPPNLNAFPLIADLLTSHGPRKGKIRLAEHRLWQNIRAQSVGMAASLLEQFDKPWALPRARRLREIPADTPFADPIELRAITAPTLVIGADRDPVHPLTIARQWADWIPTARYAQITARDHDAQQHQIDLRRTIDGFLSSL